MVSNTNKILIASGALLTVGAVAFFLISQEKSKEEVACEELGGEFNPETFECEDIDIPGGNGGNGNGFGLPVCCVPGITDPFGTPLTTTCTVNKSASNTKKITISLPCPTDQKFMNAQFITGSVRAGGTPLLTTNMKVKYHSQTFGWVKMFEGTMIGQERQHFQATPLTNIDKIEATAQFAFPLQMQEFVDNLKAEVTYLL